VDIEFTNLTVFLMVFVRISAMILMNPMFARRNVPSQVRMGIVLCLSILLSAVVDGGTIGYYSDLDIVFAMIREVLVGIHLSDFVFQIYYFLSVLHWRSYGYAVRFVHGQGLRSDNQHPNVGKWQLTEHSYDFVYFCYRQSLAHDQNLCIIISDHSHGSTFHFV